MREATAVATVPLHQTRAGAVVTGWRLPEALIAALAMLPWSLAVRGYEGGRWWDVPVVKSFVDPTLYRNDPFVGALHDGTPAAYPYQLIALVVGALRSLPLEQALLALYLPATLASLALLYMIALRLTGLAAALLLVFGGWLGGTLVFVHGERVLNRIDEPAKRAVVPRALERKPEPQLDAPEERGGGNRR